MKFLTRSNLTNFGIFFSIALGIIFPAPDQVKKTIPIFLAILLVSNFLKIEFKREKFKRRELIFYPMMTYLLMPVIIFFTTMPLPIDMRMGIFIIGITPVAIASPVVVDLINGDRELLISHVIISNFAAPLVYSVMLYIFFHAANVNIPVLSLLRDVFLLIFIPLVISRLIKLNRTVLSVSQKFFSYYTPIGFLLVIFVAVASSSAQLRNMDPETLVIVLVIIAALAATNYIVGFSLSKILKTRKALAVSFGQRNTSLAIWVGIANFNPAVVMPMVAYIIFHHVCNGILIHRFHRGKSESPVDMD